MKVDFMIIGAQKSGTTSLSYYLSNHPAVCYCLEKEPEFFSTEANWQDKIDKYHKLFEPQGAQLLGEASTNYSMLADFPKTAERIHSYNPDTKLIYITRDPVERIRSHYAHRLVRKNVLGDLHTEVLNNPSYIDRSKYYRQIEPYLRLFGKDQILLLLFEELVSKTSSYFASSGFIFKY